MSAKHDVRSEVFSIFRGLGYSTKPEQLEVITGILQRDVFVILPTGFGKSLCFQCLPLLYDKLYPNEVNSIVVVVTPLTAIMKDQVAVLSKLSIKACYISGEQNESLKTDVVKGKFQVVYFTPEMLLGCRRWREMLIGEVYTRHLRTFIVDEAHTVKKWGETFRRLLLRIGEIRSLLPSRVHVMALTATATKTLRRDVARTIGMRDEIVVSRPPMKSNVMYTVVKSSSIEETFRVVANRLQDDRTTCPRMIVYCTNYRDCADIYLYLKNYLGSSYTEPRSAPDLPRFRLVDMFMSCTEESVKESILHLFTTDSYLRIVIATVAFGMGIDCHDIRQVIHYGSPNDIESYIQQTGRAGRDNLPSLAVLVNKGGRRTYLERSMAEYASNDIICRRDTLFKDFDGYLRTYDGPLCLCCDVCQKLCKCVNCSNNHLSFTFISNA